MAKGFPKLPKASKRLPVDGSPMHAGPPAKKGSLSPAGANVGGMRTETKKKSRPRKDPERSDMAMLQQRMPR
jgi:hypothetical protein